MAGCFIHRRVLRTISHWFCKCEKWRIFIFTTGVLSIYFLILPHNSRETIREIRIRETHGMVVNLSELSLLGLNVFSLRHVGFPDLSSSDCIEAFSRNVTNKQFKQTVSRLNSSKILEDAKDCKHFLESYGMQRYPPPLQEEKEFPIAFSILFHKDFDQVLYLIRAIYRPHNLYCLHVDMKSSPEMKAAVKAAVTCLPNVIIASKLEDIIYGGYNRLQADLTCMNDSLAYPVKWRYFINLVGQQFPLKTNLELVRILKVYNGTNDVQGIFDRRMLPFRFRLQYAPWTDPKTGKVKMKKTGKRNKISPHELKMAKGSAFGAFSRAFVQFVMEDPKVADFLNWSRDAYSPDEYVWSTLQYSKLKRFKAPGGIKGKPDEKSWMSTYVNWIEDIKTPCGGTYVRNICIFSPEDLPELSRRHEFTANKFYITKNPGALHCLDQLIYNLTVSHTVRDLEFYKNLPLLTQNSHLLKKNDFFYHRKKPRLS